jgi:TolB protein
MEDGALSPPLDGLCLLFSAWSWPAWPAACGGGGGEAEETVYDQPPRGRIAFVSNRDGNDEIYVMDAAGGNVQRLTGNSERDDDPAWSPDGSLIAFQSFRTGQPDIWIMSADGSDARQVTNDPVLDGQPRWSPDGRKLAYYSFTDPASGLLRVHDLESGERWSVLDRRGSPDPRRCRGGFPGGWLKDGETLLFRGGAAGGLQICAIKEDGLGMIVIYENQGSNPSFPALSPDERKLAFVLETGGVAEIVVMDPGGGNFKQLTDFGAVANTPAWSPDSQWIAFSSNHTGFSHIYIMRPDGSDVRQLTGGRYDNRYPAWTQE